MTHPVTWSKPDVRTSGNAPIQKDSEKFKRTGGGPLVNTQDAHIRGVGRKGGEFLWRERSS